MQIDTKLKPDSLRKNLKKFWALSGEKIRNIETTYDPGEGSPVVTANGIYKPQNWTDWTQGFQYGASILHFEATDEDYFLDLAISNVRKKMAKHIAHFGVHDHGFNNVSTYGNLLRLMTGGRIPENEWAIEFYILALKMSASVQAQRWTTLPDGGYIYSFNGPHSLFVDTIRSVRVLVLGHLLDHYSVGENDKKTNLLERGLIHALTTAKYSIYYGEGRDSYDIAGRTAHESIFNINDGTYRCPSTQQGYSPFSTWTRGLSWAMLGFTELLEFLEHSPDSNAFDKVGGKESIAQTFLKAARETCDYYIENTALDGIPYWDTGAPGLNHIPEWRYSTSDPFNEWEPVDSSAAVIGAQGLLRLASYLEKTGDPDHSRYRATGLTVANTLLNEPYLSLDMAHQGLILHSIYHHPKGWDHIPPGHKVPCGESSMWGDYHARELALILDCILDNKPFFTFFDGIMQKHG